MTFPEVLGRARFCAPLLLLLTACDCGTGRSVGSPCSVPADCTGGTVCVDDRCAWPSDGTTTDAATDATSDASDAADVVTIDTSITSITLSTPPAVIDVTIGSPNASLGFTITAALASGGTMTLPTATFSVDNVSPGVINGNGQYFANGTIGGTVTVTATVVANNGTFTDDATFTVRLVQTTGAGEGPGSPGVVFGGTPVADGSADAEILYPLHGAVMPQNVQPADVQWACSGAGTACPEADMFRITITKPNLLVTHYVRNDVATPNDHYLPDGVAWRAIAQTDAASDAVIRVDRYQAAMTRVVTGVNVHVRFAQAAITGTVYYWDIDDRTIRKIEDGTSTSEILLPHIDSPAGPSADDTCVGCHSVSPSGRYMLANTHSANYGALYDLTRADLSTTNPTPSEFTESTGIQWRLSSWSPDETRAMVSTRTDPDGLRLIDPFTGGTIPTLNAAGAPLVLPSNGTMPAWANDDSAIAFVTNANSWSGNTRTGDLRLLPIVDSVDGNRFGAPTTLLDRAALNGRPEVQSFAGDRGIFYPSFAPGSAWLAFAHGTSSRSDPREANGTWSALDFAHTSSLYLIRPNGTGLQRLTRGCAATLPEQKPATSATTERTGLDFQPNFAPFQGGGYFWLSFLSRRPYGNTLSGNLEQTIHPGQIWVMAIRMNADGTVDPSEVAYWLPGQNPDHRAVSAYWAPRACRGNGEGCGVGSECCSGDCRPPIGGGASVCSPPPPAMCRQIGQTCASVSDCCGSNTDPSIVCTGNVCEQVIIIE